MKVLVVGFGQCGGRIADEFNRINNRSKSRRGIEIVTGAFAVDTDTADLSGLSSVKADHKHRILIGGKRTRGHGVAKINELGAEIAREDADKVIEAIREAKSFYEPDAIMVIAAASGGTGSGAVSIMAQHFKQRYVDTPVYAIIVLPFEHEQEIEERAIYNTAVCLKSICSVADAVFLIDNQRFVRKDSSMRNNVEKVKYPTASCGALREGEPPHPRLRTRPLSSPQQAGGYSAVTFINQLTVEPFFNLFCAGEEKRKNHIGTKVLDAGDIMQTLAGWTVMGYGKVEPSLIKLPSISPKNFMKKSTETDKLTKAVEEALSELTIQCDPNEAMGVLYLLSATTNEMKITRFAELCDYVKRLAPNAIIRGGDYPTERGIMDVVIILSQIRELEKVREYYSKSVKVAQEIKRKTDAAEKSIGEIEETYKDIPTFI